jgi:hypothetical protein
METKTIHEQIKELEKSWDIHKLEQMKYDLSESMRLVQNAICDLVFNK